MKYKCMTLQDFEEGKYRLTPIREKDMEKIRCWRNEQIEILRQAAPLSKEEQKQYWKCVVKPGFLKQRPSEILFTFLKEGEAVGYGGITHIDWEAKRGEVSFLLETSRAKSAKSYQKEYRVFLTLLKKVAFKELKFHRLFTETFDVRPCHIKTLEMFGFQLEGTLKDHVRVGNVYKNSLIHGLVNDEPI